jgi:hypothetical protein
LPGAAVVVYSVRNDFAAGRIRQRHAAHYAEIDVVVRLEAEAITELFFEIQRIAVHRHFAAAVDAGGGHDRRFGLRPVLPVDLREVAPQVNLFHFAQPTLGLPVQIARFVEHEIDAQRALDRLLVAARRARQLGVARQQHRCPQVAFRQLPEPRPRIGGIQVQFEFGHVG